MASAALEPVNLRPGSLTEIVFGRIRDAIVARELAPGSRVSESMLAGLLDVSKTPVREALLRLCHIGLVEPTGRGLRVVQPAPGIIRDAYELCAALEAGAAATAARRAEEEHRRALTEAAACSLERARAGDASGFGEWDLAFHLAVADASRNVLLAKAVRDAVTLAFTLRPRDVEDAVRHGTEHVEVGRAICDGAADHAALLMSEHVIAAMETLAGPAQAPVR